MKTPKTLKVYNTGNFISDSTNNHLITRTYNYKSEQIEYFEEKYTNNGSEIISYSPITNGEKLRTVVKEKDVFKWKPISPYKYSVIYKDSQNGRTLFENQREFISNESIKIMGATYEALKFKGSYKFISLDSKKSFEYYQYSYYVKDWGFVKHIRYFPNGKKSQLILTRIFKKEANTQN